MEPTSTVRGGVTFPPSSAGPPAEAVEEPATKYYTVGAFSHSAGTAPIVTLLILGTPLKTTHLHKDA